MSLIGDLIMSLREAATDLPLGLLSPPGNEVSVVAGAGALPAGTYYCYLTYSNPWGETTKGTVTQIVLGAPGGLTVSGTVPVGVTAINLYFGLVSGSPNQVKSFTTLPGTANAPGIPTAAPQRNSAWLPDTDGKALSVASVYRWLNDGMKAAAVLCNGGIPDISGIPSINGQAMYQLMGNWKKIDDAWYDGYAIGLGGRSSIYRKSKSSGLSGTLAVNIVSDRVIVELYPQPPRSAGASTINGAITALSTSLLMNANLFVLPFGLALIGGTEIVAYSGFNALTMQGLIRGIGGTAAQAWPDGTSIQELNIMIAGLRVPTDMVRGSALLTFNAPPGWEAPIGEYLLHRFRKLEQKNQDAQQLLQSFEQFMKNFMAANKPIAGPVQITAGGRRGPEVAAGFGSYFGGVIIP
jgi:hypothetical protein